MTKPEKKVWHDFLKNQNYRTLRQHPIDHYIVDFYIASVNLVIEIDGDSHYTEEAIDYDRERTELLEIYGLEVIRFTNDEVLQNLE